MVHTIQLNDPLAKTKHFHHNFRQYQQRGIKNICLHSWKSSLKHRAKKKNLPASHTYCTIEVRTFKALLRHIMVAFCFKYGQYGQHMSSGYCSSSQFNHIVH